MLRMITYAPRDDLKAIKQRRQKLARYITPHAQRLGTRRALCAGAAGPSRAQRGSGARPPARAYQVEGDLR